MKVHASTFCTLNVRSMSICKILILFALFLTPMRADWPGVDTNLPICEASGEQYLPQIVSDNHDGCIIIWYDARNSMDSINVYGQRVSAQGDTLWTYDGVQLTDTVSYTWISLLVACADGDGGAFFAWQDPRNGNHDVYVQHIDSTGTPLWVENGIRVSMTTNAEYVSGIVPDDRGGCVVSWEESDGSRIVLAQRLNAAGGKMWDTAGVVISFGTNEAYYTQIASDGYGGVVVCWLDGRYHPVWNEFKDIYAQRIDSLGQVCWADTGVVVLALGSAPFYSRPQIVSNMSGRFFIAWYDWRSSAFDIYAQGISQDGQVLWTTNGAAVCSEPFDQTSPRIVPDDADGLFCVWRDYGNHLCAQRLDLNGVHLWPSSGVTVASGADEVDFGNSVRASNGLFIVVYGERLPGVSDELVKAQALDTLGNIMWDPSGEPVSTVASPKSRINAMADTCGGVIAVWQDDRHGSYASDIFAQRVDPAVGLEETTVFSEVILSLRCTPNPCHNSTKIKYGLKSKTLVHLCIYDVTGRLIRNLSSGVRDPGVYELSWDGGDETGETLPGGVYFVHLETENKACKVRKVILLR